MKNWVKLIICIIAVEIIGILGGFFTAGSILNWYAGLAKPSFNPPNWIFGPVWTILYLMTGISLYLFLTGKGKSKNKIDGFWIFGVQLMLNFLWSIVFFSMHQILGALIVIALLWISIVLNIVTFYRVSKSSAYLLIPYLFWVSFASVLNFAIWMLNK
jgi:benzodiazapine receptor